jgi:GST-like protein
MLTDDMRSYCNIYTFTAIKINGEQFTTGFVEVNPNSKIPAAVDRDTADGQPIHLFESGSILLYLAEKHQRFIPSNPAYRAQVLNWLFWQMGGQGPMTGNFGHFFAYAPKDKVETRDYGVARYGMEAQRLLSVLNNHLSTRTYMVNEEYSIADIAIFPWARYLRTGGYKHSSGVTAVDFLSFVENYPHVVAWVDRIGERAAVQRGLQVNPWDGPAKPWLEPAAESESK